jgi:hypothetical protein
MLVLKFRTRYRSFTVSVVLGYQGKRSDASFWCWLGGNVGWKSVHSSLFHPEYYSGDVMPKLSGTIVFCRLGMITCQNRSVRSFTLVRGYPD